MRISYRREMGHNYLVVEPENKKEVGFEARMLAGNHIQGLLEMRIKYQEGQPLYYYDITSRQPLNRLLETRFITRDEICMILMQIHGALTVLEEYFLKEDGVLFEPEYIYVEPELFQARLCLAPEKEGDFRVGLNRLLQYILKRINHKDRECVVLAYGLYQESLKENFTMEDLLRLTATEGNKTKKAEVEEEDPIKNNFREEKCEDKEYGSGGSVGRTEDSGIPLAPPSDIQKPCLLIRKQLFFWLSVVVCLPAFFWGIKGKDTLLEYGFVFLGIDGALLVLLILGDVLILRYGGGQGKKVQICLQEGSMDNPWKILYEDEEETPRDTPATSPPSYTPNIHSGMPNPSFEEAVSNLRPPVTSQLCETPKESFQTTLLSEASSRKTVHSLISLQSSREDIPISYYPFVIGKHKDLTDYVLSKDTVSRFHLRIDREGERFLITDLNSTNGTKVNNHLLEANDTVEIKPGDELYIAEVGYRFS